MNPWLFYRNLTVSSCSFSWKSRQVLLYLLLALMLPGLTACRQEEQSYPVDVAWERTLLTGPPSTDDGSFQPRGTTQEIVLAEHSAARSREWKNPVQMVEGLPVRDSLGNGRGLRAVLRTSEENPPRMVVDVLEGEEVLFSTDAGLPSPVLPLQGLWSYGEHWVVEILQSDGEIWKGEIYQDGALLNETRSYKEAFGFQLLDGKPFYFFQRGDQLGFSYDGREANLPFDQIPHYNCCSESTINPVQAEDMVAFFGREGDDWYYTELGKWEK